MIALDYSDNLSAKKSSPKVMDFHSLERKNRLCKLSLLWLFFFFFKISFTQISLDSDIGPSIPYYGQRKFSRMLLPVTVSLTDVKTAAKLLWTS